ncbi:MAG: iron ABC transporter permease [Prolixibacteraceae bacterium]|nr:iron ABC transporter permease [Prolixibacteraceae bacterium]MBN2648108.1 iron ABC transporter permease [Prolixibacteraceae bacterium]
MNKRPAKWILHIVLLMLLVMVAMLVSLSTGESKIPLKEIPSILRSGEGIEYSILTAIRLPRIILAFAIGGALSLTGAILQGIYRNPLVEPYTLGISGGAALGVAIIIVFGLHLSISSAMLPVAGFAGSIVTIFAVYFLSLKRGVINISRMLLIGVMISFIASSGMMFLMAISSSENLHGIIFWMMGSLDEPNTMLIRIMFYSALAGLVIAYLFARPLNALRLGEEKARHLGINTNATLRILFIVASLLTGFCVAVAGIIGFVGLVIPHIMRNITGSDYRILLGSSFLGGSFFLIVSDIIARTIISPNELPIGVITGIVGGLVFIIVLARTGLKSKIS